jgi:hypothetical protein
LDYERTTSILKSQSASQKLGDRRFSRCCQRDRHSGGANYSGIRTKFPSVTGTDNPHTTIKSYPRGDADGNPNGNPNPSANPSADRNPNPSADRNPNPGADRNPNPGADRNPSLGADRNADAHSRDNPHSSPSAHSRDYESTNHDSYP